MLTIFICRLSSGFRRFQGPAQNMIPIPRLALALALPLMLAATGCKSSKAGDSASFASVVILGSDEAQIRATTGVVFKEHGYESLGAVGSEMIFEKRGSLANDIAYGGWIDDRTTRVRVKAEIVPLPDGSHRLGCQVAMVQHAEDSFFREEHKLSRWNAGPYRKLLEETARRLK